MGLDMFLQVLRTLECFSTEFTFVGFEWNMHTNMRCNMVAFDGSSTA